MKKHLLKIILLISISTYAYASKIGYVNVEHLLVTLPQVKQASIDIKKEFKPRESKLIKLSTELKDKIKDFNINKVTMAENKVKEEVDKLVKLESNLKTMAEKLQKDIESKNIKTLGVIQDLINNAINDIATANDYDIILYQKIAFVSNKVDITELVSKKLNKIEK